MRTIENQEAKIISTGASNVIGAKKVIEKAARTCYHSIDKMTAESYEQFVQRLIEAKHFAMLEHGTIYLRMPRMESLKRGHLYGSNPYSFCFVADHEPEYMYITTNYRVIVENGWEDDLEYISEYVEGKHEERITFHLLTNIQVANEFVRHRVFSFAQESTRFCKYNSDKFNKELTFIVPHEMKNYGPYDKNDNKTLIIWTNAMTRAEEYYFELADAGCSAQECAQVLPKATKTELIMTGTIPQWKQFIDIRYNESTGPVHPQAKELARLINEKLCQHID